MADKTTKIFVITNNNWLAHHLMHFEVVENVTEGPKTYTTNDRPRRVYKKDNPLIFSDGIQACEEFIRLAAQKRIKVEGLLARLDKEVVEVDEAMRVALKRKDKS